MGKEYKVAKNGRYYCLVVVNGKRRSRFVSAAEYKSKGGKGAGFRTGGFMVGGKLKKLKVGVSGGVRIGAVRSRTSIGKGGALGTAANRRKAKKALRTAVEMHAAYHGGLGTSVDFVAKHARKLAGKGFMTGGGLVQNMKRQKVGRKAKNTAYATGRAITGAARSVGRVNTGMRSARNSAASALRDLGHDAYGH